MAVPANKPVWQGFQQLWVQGLIAQLAVNAWQCLSAGHGTKGPQLHDRAVLPVNPPLTSGRCRWVLARRGLDLYEVHLSSAWYRYITLAPFDPAFLTVIRA
jgi:hypothetical protein